MSRPRRTTIRVGGQNMTEGPVTDELRSCSVLLLQETDPGLVREGLGDHWRSTYAPGGHIGIAWDTDVWQLVEGPHVHRFHGSGTGDPDIPDAIATPARHLLEVHLRHRYTGVVVAFFCTWLLNSWAPVRGDRWTKTREGIVLQRELPVVRRRLAACRKAGLPGVAEADWNTLRRRLRFRGWRFRPTRGLDRFAWTRHKQLRLVDVHESAKTGRGNDMQHNGLIATFEIGD